MPTPEIVTLTTPCVCSHAKHSHFDEVRWCDSCECDWFRVEGQRLRDVMLPSCPPEDQAQETCMAADEGERDA